MGQARVRGRTPVTRNMVGVKKENKHGVGFDSLCGRRGGEKVGRVGDATSWKPHWSGCRVGTLVPLVSSSQTLELILPRIS